MRALGQWLLTALVALSATAALAQVEQFEPRASRPERDDKLLLAPVPELVPETATAAYGASGLPFECRRFLCPDRTGCWCSAGERRGTRVEVQVALYRMPELRLAGATNAPPQPLELAVPRWTASPVFLLASELRHDATRCVLFTEIGERRGRWVAHHVLLAQVRADDNGVERYLGPLPIGADPRVALYACAGIPPD